MSQLEETFKTRYGGVAEQLSRDDFEMTVCRLASQRLVSKALQVRKEHAGLLLGSSSLSNQMKRVTLVKAVTLGLLSPFSMRQPTNLLLLDTPIPINERGECVVTEEIPCEPLENVPSVDSDSAQTPKYDSVPKLCKKWQCHKECRPLSVSEVDAILDFRSC